MAHLPTRQRLLRVFYPLVMFFSKLAGKNGRTISNRKGAHPSRSIYELSVELNSGERLPLAALRGKKLLLVNTASNCGYAGQYAELQQLHEQYGDKLAIIGFPANDFKEQEKGGDEEIAGFCQRNFGVSFPLAKKSSVIKSSSQNPVFQWLTSPELNGWNDQPPAWNFSKYLVSEEGVLTHYFDAAVSPLAEEVRSSIVNRE
jgi:glutathione peroxidase